MTMYAIDTLEFAKKLRTAGLAQDQAEAIAEAHGQAFREAAEHTLATKQDLAEHPTKEDLDKALEPYATKQDLAEHPTKEDLDKALEPYATKQDLADIKSELKAELHELKTDQTELRADMKVLKWGMGIVIAVVLIPALRDLLSLIG